MRRLLPPQARIKTLLDLRDSKVFEKALNYPAICVVEKGAPEDSYLFPAGRAFADPANGDIGVLLREARGLLQRAEVASSHGIGACSDAFPMSSRHLEEGSWLLMPVSEREVFDVLEDAATHRLQDVTLTEGSVFEGLSTGADDVMVLQLVEARDSSLLLKPRGAGRNGIPDEVEIEKGILRRWYYGRDIERWFVGWEGWYVIWPYTDIEGAMQLIPSSPSVEHFPYAHRVEAVDVAFPHAWQYLTRPAIERVLRARERGSFTRGRQAHRWYAFSAPRSLQLYTHKKVCVPELTRTPDGAPDEEGGAFGPGICGIALKDETLIYLMTALVNSSPLFYWLKQSSVVHGGHHLKYDDRFCKQLPIKLPQTEREGEIADRLSALAQQLTDTKGDLRQLEEERRAFPGPQAADLGPGTELYPLRRLVSGEPRSQTIDTQDYSVSQALDGRWGLRLGRATLFFPTRGHLQVVEKWFNLQRRRRVPSASLMELRLPTSETGCHLVLDVLERMEAEIASLRSRLERGEGEIDRLVAEFYGLTR